jgi:hypothetical protein
MLENRRVALEYLVNTVHGAYYRVLGLFPREFREEYRNEMLSDFEDLRLQFERKGGRWWPVRFARRTLLDTLAAVVRENIEVRRNRMNKKNILAILIGILLLAYSTVFAAVNIAKYSLGFSEIRDPFEAIVANTQSSLVMAILNALIIFGPAVAFLLFMVPNLQLSLGWKNEEGVRIVFRRGSSLSYVLMGLCLIIAAIFALYFVAENLPCLLGQRLAC